MRPIFKTGFKTFRPGFFWAVFEAVVLCSARGKRIIVLLDSPNPQIRPDFEKKNSEILLYARYPRLKCKLISIFLEVVIKGNG